MSIENFLIVGDDFVVGRLNSLLSPGAATQRCIDINNNEHWKEMRCFQLYWLQCSLQYQLMFHLLKLQLLTPIVSILSLSLSILSNMIVITAPSVK